ncbi:MAG: S-layer homology domain-containing protein [Acidaminobacteraceae bacterium]
MEKRWISIILLVCLLISIIPITFADATNGYIDVPSDHWSVDVVNSARNYGLMQGSGDEIFGFGNTISKAEFITVLDRMFGWEIVSPDNPSFSDVAADMWYYKYIETALRHNVVDSGQQFSPNALITREEMAVMLVRSLGYKSLAQDVTSFGNKFTDVTRSAGYINIASDIGMTNGTSETTFSPSLTAKREEAAAMLVRVYEKHIEKTDWSHAFYALSSYSQKELSKDMNAVSVGWSRMSYSDEQGAYLNMTSSNSNEYSIPKGYEDIATYFKDNKTKVNLSIYMDTSTKVKTASGSIDICSAILLDSTQRSKAVDSIINEITINYDRVGYNPYSGVTIDFEGMRGGALKDGFNAFLTELSNELKPLSKTLYVAVQPVTRDGIYYDSYDYRFIGNLADKVILMAHDYNATSMPENLLGSQYYQNTPVTPLADVYYALRKITDKSTGVENTSKIALAISFDSVGWELQDGKLASTSSYSPSPSTIYGRLKGGAVISYSDKYRNPYISYTTEEGKDIFLWYEDERSVNDKIELAKLFGIKGVSIWRLGTIPNYTDEGLYYNLMNSFK